MVALFSRAFARSPVLFSSFSRRARCLCAGLLLAGLSGLEPGGVMAVAQAAPEYDQSSRVLTLPSLLIDGTYYYGVKVRLDSFTLTQGATGSGSCDAGDNVELATQSGFSCFGSQAEMLAALVGNWSYAGSSGDVLRLGIVAGQNIADGYFGAYRDGSRTLHNCKFSALLTSVSPATGTLEYSIDYIDCDEGVVSPLSGSINNSSDTLTLRVFGGKGRAEQLRLISNMRSPSLGVIPMQRR